MSNFYFNQISIYLINANNLPNLETIDEKLAKAQFQPCTGLEWSSIGFTNPVEFTSNMVFPAQNTIRIALKKEEKVLPSTVINDLLEEKINLIREVEGRKVGRKEKQQLKDTITDDLLPRAFTKSNNTDAIIDTKREEITKLLHSGKVVTQLGLSWNDRVRFVLTDNFTLKRIQFLDIIQEEASGQADDDQSLAYASQILMAEALGELLDELVSYLGGWVLN